jgi:hypothetical protein
MDTIRSMGCTHTHWKILVIEGCGNPSHVWNVVKKLGESNRNAEKIGWIINQTLALRLKHDKILT